MPGVDDSKPFYPLRIAVLTISDTRTMETDKSGSFLTERLQAAGHELSDYKIVKDDIDVIQTVIKDWIADAVEIIITTGGTGFSPRDVTPEAIKPLFRREMDGFSTVFHQVSMSSVGVSTLQSRAFAGQAEDTFIFSLPGSTGACRDGWDNILAYELDSRYRPCSIVSHVKRYEGLC